MQNNERDVTGALGSLSTNTSHHAVLDRSDRLDKNLALAALLSSRQCRVLLYELLCYGFGPWCRSVVLLQDVRVVFL
jgi:hypothetical protein